MRRPSPTGLLDIYRPPTAEESVRAAYVQGLIDIETMERALHEIIVEGRTDVPAYVSETPAERVLRSVREFERAGLVS